MRKDSMNYISTQMKLLAFKLFNDFKHFISKFRVFFFIIFIFSLSLHSPCTESRGYNLESLYLQCKREREPKREPKREQAFYKCLWNARGCQALPEMSEGRGGYHFVSWQELLIRVWLDFDNHLLLGFVWSFAWLLFFLVPFPLSQYVLRPKLMRRGRLKHLSPLQMLCP